MHITPIPILNDNYVWLLVKDNNAVAVDIGDDKPVLDYLHEHNLTLSAILITHHHDDHIGGVASAKSAYPNAKIYAHKSHLNAIGMTPDVACDEGSEFELLGLTFKVWKTAGHTDTHLSYLCDMANITHVFVAIRYLVAVVDGCLRGRLGSCLIAWSGLGVCLRRLYFIPHTNTRCPI